MAESIPPSTSRRDDEIALALFFPSTSEGRTYSERDCEEVSRILTCLGKTSWSKLPRTYVVLRIIDRLDIMDDFMAKSISDFSFPFSETSLPDALKSPTARQKFLETQEKVLSKGFDLERGSKGRHRHISKEDCLPFHTRRKLGRGGYGEVDCVMSTISLRTYARKRIFRGRTFQRNHEVLRDFENELAALKQVSHRHIIEFVGSYTDPKFVGLIMLPVADGDLWSYMRSFPLDEAQKSHMAGFFGCLATALTYLHDNRIRHKDIKPRNILIHKSSPVLTDFGLALDWSEKGRSTTISTPAGLTLRYAAPEVAYHAPRSTPSDVWSLGCVFLEMYTVMQDKSLEDLDKFQMLEGRQIPNFCQNIEATELWTQRLPKTADRPILECIQEMLKELQDDRPSARQVMDNIKRLNSVNKFNFAFCGACCEEDEDSEENVYSSDDEEVLPLMTPRASSKGRRATIRITQNKPSMNGPARSAAITTIQDVTTTDVTKNVRERKDRPVSSNSPPSRPSLPTPPPSTPTRSGPTAIKITRGDSPSSWHLPQSRPTPHSPPKSPPLNRPTVYNSSSSRTIGSGPILPIYGVPSRPIESRPPAPIYRVPSRPIGSGPIVPIYGVRKSDSAAYNPPPSIPIRSRPTVYGVRKSESASYPPPPPAGGPTRSASTAYKLPKADSASHSPPTPLPPSSRPTRSASTAYKFPKADSNTDYPPPNRKITQNLTTYDTVSAADFLIEHVSKKDRDRLIKALRMEANDGLNLISNGANDGLNQMYTFVTDSADFPETHQMTPIHWTALENDLNSFMLLLDKGADTERYDARGLTALHVASGIGTSETSIVFQLLKNNAKINSRTGSAKQTALHIAALSGSREVLNLLLGFGAEINAVDAASNTPLSLAVQLGREGIVEALLQSGALYDTAFWDFLGMRRLARRARNDKVRIMIEMRMDETLLFTAAQTGDMNGLLELLGKGTNPQVKDHRGKTPYDYAVLNGHIEVAEYLTLRHGNQEPVLAKAGLGFPTPPMFLRTSSEPAVVERRG